MIQDKNTILENYRANCAMFNKIKAKNIEMVIVGHLHIDHIGAIPMLFARGNENAKIFVPKDSTSILKEMWLDCAYINNRDCETLAENRIRIILHCTRMTKFIQRYHML